MSTTDRCPKCGAMVLPEESFCLQCGATLGATASAAPVQASAQIITGTPRTIEQLKLFCAQKGIPLEEMRFFIGEDCREPKAFGIYQDGNRYVAYENKADGKRAELYGGFNESGAVYYLYEKLLEECHDRKIWPDGLPKAELYKTRSWSKRREKRRTLTIGVMILVVILGLIVGILTRLYVSAHRYDGYYRFDDSDTYYRYGDRWYLYDIYDDWIYANDHPYYEDYEDYYLGEDYDSTWAVSDFESSDIWEKLNKSDNDSSSNNNWDYDDDDWDYDSWDSNDTDWDSDW